jgi:hypothetical protein
MVPLAGQPLMQALNTTSEKKKNAIFLEMLFLT